MRTITGCYQNSKAGGSAVSTCELPAFGGTPRRRVASSGRSKTSLLRPEANREARAMGNERLRRAIQQSGLRLEDVADHVEIDAKTAERWITKGRLPHARNRARTAQLLNVDELELWPEVADGRNG